MKRQVLFSVNSRVVYSVLFYLLLIILLNLAKPSMIYDQDGKPKEFGIGDDKTMFSLGVLTVVLAILCFYTFCIIDLIFAAGNGK